MHHRSRRRAHVFFALALAVVAVLLIAAGSVGIGPVRDILNTVTAGAMADDADVLAGRSQKVLEQGSVQRAPSLVDGWVAPAGMPATGLVEQVLGGIPNTNSGFEARPASVYLPPAARTAHPPRLPVLVFMMGQPGDPDPTVLASTLDRFAARNGGLAPIAVVIDQLSRPDQDPLCLDADLGDVETYVMRDVVPWIRAHERVPADRRYWSIGGFSNGAECATYFGSKYPNVFGNVIAVSPVEWEGKEHNDDVLQHVFHGDQHAYDAAKPASIMAADAPYRDTVAIFAAGAQDSIFGPDTQRLAKAAASAGMATSFFRVPDAGHDMNGLAAGLTDAFGLLYPRWGLSASG